MRQPVVALATILLGTMVLTTGCTTKKRHQRDITNLQSQIGALQSDVTRLDQAVRDSEMALKAAQERGAGTSGASGGSVFEVGDAGPVYRTPSGFELPAKSIQRALKSAGYYQGTIDGKVGSGTRQAIRDFQRDQGLTTDGICGRQTWAHLQSFA